MLDTDICLTYLTNKPLADCLFNRKTNGFTRSGCHEKFDDEPGELTLAANGNCCAWVADGVLFDLGILKVGDENEFCGTTIRASDENTGRSAR
jgi:hypothetical protein